MVDNILVNAWIFAKTAIINQAIAHKSEFRKKTSDSDKSPLTFFIADPRLN